jgi:hypothetical protein
MDQSSSTSSSSSSQQNQTPIFYGPLPPNWSRQWSKSQNREYFFNDTDGTRVWYLHEIIPILPQPITSLDISLDTIITSSNLDSTIPKRLKSHTTNNNQPKIAIIVPFRDLHPIQQRKAHLVEFTKYMPLFLHNAGASPESKIYIIEQSNDTRKFNRGKLLNIGFHLARKEGLSLSSGKSSKPFDTFIFHDVDLIPHAKLGPFYVRQIPGNHPLHIARCWNRYSNNPEYFGGIVSFNQQDFERIDGFPNIYWGWGGEDDELKARVNAAGFTVDFPPPEEFGDCIKDLEEMSLTQKLSVLRENREWKCLKKWEANKEHQQLRDQLPHPQWWGVDGIKYHILFQDEESMPGCVKITVDVLLNYELSGAGHWTNEEVKE